MAPITINGRFSRDAVTHIGVHVTSITFDHECVIIRLDHAACPEYWQEIRIHESELCRWHAEIGANLLQLAQDSPEYQRFMNEAVHQLMTGEWHETVRTIKAPPWDE